MEAEEAERRARNRQRRQQQVQLDSPAAGAAAAGGQERSDRRSHGGISGQHLQVPVRVMSVKTVLVMVPVPLATDKQSF